MKSHSFIKGAAVVAAGGLLAKMMGAVYRILLMDALGGRGMGMYQMVFPLYSLLITLASTGVPSALARLVAERAEGQGRAVLRAALPLFGGRGLGSLAMFLLAPAVAAAQGSRRRAAYRLLAPSCCSLPRRLPARLLQGNSRFAPGRFRVVEQAVKIAFGLFCAAIPGDAARAVSGRCSPSPSASLPPSPSSPPARAGDARCRSPRARLPLRARWVGGRFPSPRPSPVRPPTVRARALLRAVLPVAVAAGALPCAASPKASSSCGWSAATRKTRRRCTGCTRARRLRSSTCPSPSATASRRRASPQSRRCGRRGGSGGGGRALFALKCTLYLAFPAAAALFAFPAPVCSLLFRLPAEEGAALARLVRILSLSAVPLAAVQTLSACLTGLGRSKRAALSVALACALRLGAEAVLLRYPQISVFGAAYAAGGCYLVAFLLNLYYSIKERKNRIRIGGHALKFALLSAAAAGAAWPLRELSVFAALAAAAAVYLALSVPLRAFRPEEVRLAWRNRYDRTRRTWLQPR